MFLNGLATAVPPRRYTQAECLAALEGSPQYSALGSRSHSLLKRVLSGAGREMTRHLAVDELSQAFELSPDALHARFERHAPRLAAQAAKDALRQARLGPGEIDAVVISTCTGYLCPGLTSYVSEELGLRQDVFALDLVGQGCGAALPNWRASSALLKSGAADNVLSVCVEVCSAAFYLDDDPGVLISACLFGDGAGAVILSTEAGSTQRRVEMVDCSTLQFPTERQLLRFESRQGMLRNILSREVPEVAAGHVADLLVRMLERTGLGRDEVTEWIVHAGGPNVLAALQKQACFNEEELALSYSVLKDFANVSSPFVLFVLDRALTLNKPGGWWWMSSFGAGFSCHGALLKVD